MSPHRDPLAESARPLNSILAALSAEDFARISPELRLVELPQANIIYEPGHRIQYVLFPETSLISVLAQSAEGSSVEISQIGKRGMLGIYLALGTQYAHLQSIVSIAGTALQMSAAAFLREYNRPGAFQNEVFRCVRRQLYTISQRVACNRTHSIEQRLAYLLLSIHDHLGQTEFSMTHEFMSALMGSARSEVAKVAHKFRESGYIQYVRANVSIVNRAGLEAAVCECYRAVREVFER